MQALDRCLTYYLLVYHNHILIMGLNIADSVRWISIRTFKNKLYKSQSS